MGLIVALLLSVTPCDALWPNVWKAYEKKELSHGLPPLFQRVPNAKELLGRAWIVECAAFNKESLDCAKGVTREAELARLRRMLEAERVPPAEIDKVLQKARSEWSPLECREVDRALDRAGAAVAREVLDAGVLRSDACAGEDLASGRCQCAHQTCMDLCCPDGWACAHTGAAQVKCIKPR